MRKNNTDNKRIKQAESAKSQWYDLVCETEAICGQQVPVEVEAYLVNLLESYTNQPEIVTRVFGMDYLQCAHLQGHAQKEALQELADSCLLFSGFFPAYTEHLHVEPDYFVRLGQSAYAQLGGDSDNIYSLLSQYFVPAMDILLCMRDEIAEHPKLSKSQLKALWESSGSEYAHQMLQGGSFFHPNHLFK